jgi:hypothetical protein
MAQNRMWLRHKGTGKSFLLAEYYNGRSLCGWGSVVEEKEIDNFFSAIQMEAANSFDWLWGPTDFELVFEEEANEDHPNKQNLPDES